MANKSQAIYESKVLKHKDVIPTMIRYFELIIILDNSAFKLKTYLLKIANKHYLYHYKVIEIYRTSLTKIFSHLTVKIKMEK